MNHKYIMALGPRIAYRYEVRLMRQRSEVRP